MRTWWLSPVNGPSSAAGKLSPIVSKGVYIRAVEALVGTSDSSDNTIVEELRISTYIYPTQSHSSPSHPIPLPLVIMAWLKSSWLVLLALTCSSVLVEAHYPLKRPIDYGVPPERQPANPSPKKCTAMNIVWDGMLIIVLPTHLPSSLISGVTTGSSFIMLLTFLSHPSISQTQQRTEQN